MLSGPQNMPKFSDRQLTPDEKKDIIAYIKMASDTKNQGGYGLGGFGPTSEAWAMWLIGIVAMTRTLLRGPRVPTSRSPWRRRARRWRYCQHKC